MYTSPAIAERTAATISSTGDSFITYPSAPSSIER